MTNTTTQAYRIRNGSVIETYGSAVEIWPLAQEIAANCVGVTQAKSIIIERIGKRGETSPEDECVTVSEEISSGRLNNGAANHMIYRTDNEQKWHAKCRSVTRFSKGPPHIYQTGARVDCKACLR